MRSRTAWICIALLMTAAPSALATGVDVTEPGLSETCASDERFAGEWHWEPIPDGDAPPENETTPPPSASGSRGWWWSQSDRESACDHDVAYGGVSARDRHGTLAEASATGGNSTSSSSSDSQSGWWEQDSSGSRGGRSHQGQGAYAEGWRRDVRASGAGAEGGARVGCASSYAYESNSHESYWDSEQHRSSWAWQSSTYDSRYDCVRGVAVSHGPRAASADLVERCRSSGTSSGERSSGSWEGGSWSSDHGRSDSSSRCRDGAEIDADGRRAFAGFGHECDWSSQRYDSGSESGSSEYRRSSGNCAGGLRAEGPLGASAAAGPRSAWGESCSPGGNGTECDWYEHTAWGADVEWKDAPLGPFDWEAYPVWY